MPAKHRKASEYDDVERRIRAAMWIAGLEFSDLAQRINMPKLGESTLRRLTGQTSTRMQLEPIAKACGLTYDFFTVDFSRLPELQDEAQPADLQNQIDALRGDLEILAGEVRRQNDASGQTNPGQAPPGQQQ